MQNQGSKLKPSQGNKASKILTVVDRSAHCQLGSSAEPKQYGYCSPGELVMEQHLASGEESPKVSFELSFPAFAGTNLQSVRCDSAGTHTNTTKPKIILYKNVISVYSIVQVHNTLCSFSSRNNEQYASILVHILLLLTCIVNLYIFHFLLVS